MVTTVGVSFGETRGRNLGGKVKRTVKVSGKIYEW
jgi:hypothetical protein